MVIRHPALKTFGHNVKTCRSAKQLSQEKLAEIAELDPTYISGIERGVRNPSVLSILRIAKALGTEAMSLFEGVKA